MYYLNFDLLATQAEVTKDAAGKHWLAFRVQVTSSPEGSAHQGLASRYELGAVEDYRQRLSDRDLAWPKLIQFGGLLADALFPPGSPIRDLLERSLVRVRAEDQGLRLSLSLDPLMSDVPWEAILINFRGGEATQTDFLALMPEVSIVRYRSAMCPEFATEAKLPARILVALASPRTMQPLDLAMEQASLESALAGRAEAQVSYQPHATRRILMDQEPAHVFHFSGHGTFEEVMSTLPGVHVGEGHLVFDDGKGGHEFVPAGQVALNLRGRGVRVAVLNACLTGQTDRVNLWSSAATAMLKADLGAVVGMQFTVGDQSAIDFSRNCYQILVEGRTVDEAVSGGRRAVAAAGDLRGWVTPVLYLNTPDGVIFPEFAPSRPPDKIRSTAIKGAASLLPDKAQAGETHVEPVRLTLVQRPELVEHASGRQAHHPLIPVLPKDSTIWKAFENALEHLLIVGPRGSGKETILSQLGRTLMKLAERDESEPVPVMLTLSRWSEGQGEEAQPKAEALIHWLTEEFKEHWIIGEDNGPDWIKEKKFALLLDDLDQLEIEERTRCVATINKFVRAHYPITTVVCSRIEEYEELPEHLRLLDAVEILALTEVEVEKQLAGAGEHLEALRTAIREQDTLGLLAKWPEDLDIMSEIYWDRPVDPPPPTESIEECRTYLYKQYVKRRLEENKEDLSDKGYTPEQTVHWLRWLAHKMKQHRDVRNWFLIERMQPSWLDKPGQNSKKQSKQRQWHSLGSALAVLLLTIVPFWWWVWCVVELIVGEDGELFSRAIVGPALGLAFGLMVLHGVRRDFGRRAKWVVFLAFALAFALGVGGVAVWDPAEPLWGVGFGLGCGFFFGLLMTLIFISFGKWLARWTRTGSGEIQTVEELRWSWWRGLPGLLLGVVVSLAFGILFELVVSASWTQRAGPAIVNALECGTPVALALGRIEDCGTPWSWAFSQSAWAALGLWMWLMFGLTAIKVEEKEKVMPNQGILGSVRNAIKYGLASGLAIALPFAASGILAAQHFPYFFDLVAGVAYGVAFGLVVGCAVGLLLGGYAAIQHGLLRLILHRMDRIPWDYEGFLDYATELGFLTRLGGAFEFRYSRLQDHLANEWSEQDGKDHAIP